MFESLLLEALLKSLDKGIELVRESDRQRKLFFETVALPTHQVFERLRDDHLKTFREVWSLLEDPAAKPIRIADFCRAKILFESDTPQILQRLTQKHQDEALGWHDHKPPTSVAGSYRQYVQSIAACLTLPQQYDDEPKVLFYGEMREGIARLLVNADSLDARERAQRGLTATIAAFQEFSAEVSSNYMDLQRRCLAP